MISTSRSFFKPLVYALANPIAKTGLNPNVITLLGIIPPALFATSLITHNFGWTLLSSILFATDFVDGAVARITGKTSLLGGLLDSSLDRITDAVVISSFGFAGIVRWEIIIVMLTSAFMISYTRAKTEHLHYQSITNIPPNSPQITPNFATGLLQRTERLIGVVLGLALWLIWPNIYVWTLNLAEAILSVLTILSVITVLQRFILAHRILSAKPHN